MPSKSSGDRETKRKKTCDDLKQGKVFKLYCITAIWHYGSNSKIGGVEVFIVVVRILRFNVGVMYCFETINRGGNNVKTLYVSRRRFTVTNVTRLGRDEDERVL